jgi:hypothetical protein
MLPDFPKIKKKHVEAINNLLKEELQSDPLFTGIREEHHFEGSSMTYKTVDGEPNENGNWGQVYFLGIPSREERQWL